MSRRKPNPFFEMDKAFHPHRDRMIQLQASVERRNSTLEKMDDKHKALLAALNDVLETIEVLSGMSALGEEGQRTVKQAASQIRECQIILKE